MLIKTHNSRLWGSPEFHTDYIGVTEAGARYLVDHGVKVRRRRLPVGRAVQEAGAPAHHVLLGAGTIIIEGLNLRDVEPGIYEMFCLPLRSSAPTARRRASCCAGAERVMSALLDDSLVIVLAGGAGERLYPLTKERAKPAVYFGGPYRIIDFALSNCINSGLRRIFIATQYKSLSLNRHIRMGWSIVVGGARRVRRDPAAAEARRRALVSGHGRRGLPEPLLDHAREPAPRRSCCPATTSTRWTTRRCCGSTRSAAPRSRWPPSRCRSPTRSRFGIVAVDETERVIGFQEKPQHADADSRLAGRRAGVDGHLHLRHRRRWSARSKPTRASRPSHDFGKDIIPALIHEAPVYAYRFYDENKKAAKYWRDIGTLDAYFEANMDLCQVNPEFNLYDPEWPLRTYQPQAPPAKFVFAEEGRRCGQALDSVISPGCIISGSRIIGSVLCPNVRVHSFCAHRADAS